MNTVALIPLRGGSKSIPDKNIMPIAGKPLCAWTIEAALACPAIDAVWVSTDSPRIRDTVQAIDARVQVLDRPAALASDTAGTEAVMQHFIATVPCDRLLTIQATSPLLSSADLNAAITQYERDGVDSMLSAVRCKRFFWQDDGTPINYDPQARPRRQDFAGSLMENGAFYISTRAGLQTSGCRLHGRIGIYEMPSESDVEIDEPDDWQIVERRLLARRERLPDVDVLICDVDGTLTDAAMFYHSDGELLKRFDTRDGKALELWRAAGKAVWIITREDSDIVRARARKLNIEDVYVGITDKVSLLERLCQERGIAPERIAYIGDDINDIPAMRRCAIRACPGDAQPEVKRIANLPLQTPGGHGAVRELVRRLLGPAQV